jgi:hypothetical protein
MDSRAVELRHRTRSPLSIDCPNPRAIAVSRTLDLLRSWQAFFLTFEHPLTSGVTGSGANAGVTDLLLTPPVDTSVI